MCVRDSACVVALVATVRRSLAATSRPDPRIPDRIPPRVSRLGHRDRRHLRRLGQDRLSRLRGRRVPRRGDGLHPRIRHGVARARRADCHRHRCSTPGRSRSSSPRWPSALAIQQGKLSYDDSIRKYLPELPAYADAIKVSHLLHHTSGLRDYNTLLSIAGRRDEDAWDNRVVLQMTARQTQLNFTPGDEYLYSNTGYTLLATIVERATGTPFAAFADANIFKPLGMEVTHYHVDASRLVRASRAGLRRARRSLDARHADQRARRRRRALHEHPRSPEVGRELLHRPRRRTRRC